MRYDSTSLSRIVADKSHRVTPGLATDVQFVYSLYEACVSEGSETSSLNRVILGLKLPFNGHSLEKTCFLHNMEKFCNLSEVFMEKTR